MLKLKRLDSAIYTDTMGRYWLGFRGKARVWVNGKRETVEDRLQFLLLDGVSGMAQAEDYDVIDDAGESVMKAPPFMVDVVRQVETLKAQVASLMAGGTGEAQIVKCEKCGAELSQGAIKAGHTLCRKCRD